MSELKIPEDINSLPVFVVREDSPAAEVLFRMCSRSIKPGALVFVSEEEFESLREDLMLIIWERAS